MAHTFFSVYEIGIDTIFVCFAKDETINDGTAGREYYMSKNLMVCSMYCHIYYTVTFYFIFLIFLKCDVMFFSFFQQWVDNSSEAMKNLKKKKGQQKAQAKAAKSGDVVSQQHN